MASSLASGDAAVTRDMRKRFTNFLVDATDKVSELFYEDSEDAEERKADKRRNKADPELPEALQNVLQDIFRTIDSDHDGQITALELRHCLGLDRGPTLNEACSPRSAKPRSVSVISDVAPEVVDSDSMLYMLHELHDPSVSITWERFMLLCKPLAVDLDPNDLEAVSLRCNDIQRFFSAGINDTHDAPQSTRSRGGSRARAQSNVTRSRTLSLSPR